MIRNIKYKQVLSNSRPKYLLNEECGTKFYYIEFLSSGFKWKLVCINFFSFVFETQLFNVYIFRPSGIYYPCVQWIVTRYYNLSGYLPEKNVNTGYDGVQPVLFKISPSEILCNGLDVIKHCLQWSAGVFVT